MPAEAERATRVEFTPEFKRCLRALAKRYPAIRSDLEPVILALEDGQCPGDRVRGIGHVVVKVRARNSNAQRGRSGGYRVIYQVVGPQRVVLLTLYSKSDQDDVSAAQIRKIIRAWEERPKS